MHIDFRSPTRHFFFDSTLLLLVQWIGIYRAPAKCSENSTSLKFSLHNFFLDKWALNWFFCWNNSILFSNFSLYNQSVILQFVLNNFLGPIITISLGVLFAYFPVYYFMTIISFEIKSADKISAFNRWDLLCTKPLWLHPESIKWHYTNIEILSNFFYFTQNLQSVYLQI